MTTLLGVDVGERRIGLAIGDATTGAVPLATIRRGRTVEADVDAIRHALGGTAVDELVVGLPLELRSGDEGPQAASTRAWAETAAALLHLPLVLCDERRSSQRAEERLGPMPRGRSGGPPTPGQRDKYRARVDREAAAVILQAELDARATTRDDPGNVRSAAAVAAPEERR